MKNLDRKNTQFDNRHSTNVEHSLVRQKLINYSKATKVTLDDVKYIRKTPDSSSNTTPTRNVKYRTRIIKFAKLVKINVSQICGILKKEFGEVVYVQSFVDNRLLSSLIAQNKISSKYIQKSIISFENITFYDGYIEVGSGKLKSLIINNEDSSSLLNILHKYWLNTNQLFEIYYASNQILAISPLLDINKYVQELYAIASRNVEAKDGKLNHVKEISSLSIQETIPQEVIQREISFKNPYIDFLSLHQNDNVIYRCLEQNNTTKEECFIFTIPIDNERMAQVFENVNFGRSTEIFISDKEKSKACIEKVFCWFTSHKTNKREILRSKLVENDIFEAIEYCSIPHQDINQWIFNINRIININPDRENYLNFIPGFRDTKDVTKDVHSSGSYNVRNIHKKLARKLYKTLNDQYPNQVGTEIQITGQNRIDIVVKNIDGSYLFYEIKSHNDALKCIREGVGQLMNYKFLVRGCCRVSKLIIVGIAEKTKEIEDYMAIYNSEDLPISYMQITI
mgnify:CR=1 FL=1